VGTYCWICFDFITIHRILYCKSTKYSSVNSIHFELYFMKLDQRQNLHDMHEFDVGKGTISLTTSSISGKCFSRSVFDIMSKK